MRSRLKPTILLLFLVLLGSSYTSCDLINPEEQIPSFLKIDSISLSTISGQGPDDHNMVDAWVFENEQLIGIYELPTVVPILKNGDSDIRIRGGIKLNGQVASRIPYLFTEDFQASIELFPDSQISINPTLSFHDWVTYKWLEDFEGVGLSLAATSISDSDPIRINGSDAYEGKSLKLALDENQTFFECKTGQVYDLPGSGAPVFLEFTYRNNHPFRVGLFSRDQTGTFQVVVMVLNASEDWNRIYVNLTDIISSNSGFIDHQPFFGFIRDENHEGEAYVILDNVRMLH
jgi:hypothetical protein